jgi:hypothetical protein
VKSANGKGVYANEGNNGDVLIITKKLTENRYLAVGEWTVALPNRILVLPLVTPSQPSAQHAPYQAKVMTHRVYLLVGDSFKCMLGP